MIKDLNTYWKNQLSGKRVLITGGSTGIGREVALLLAAFGARCLICGRNREQIDETLKTVQENSPGAYCQGVTADLALQEDIESLRDVDSMLGGLDIMVNNAALAFGSINEGHRQIGIR